MPFDPHGYLTLADRLATASSASEAELRTAVSRAYYALHLRARENLAAAGELKATGTGADHELVISGLRGRGGSLGDQLDWLRIRRIRADYRLASTVGAQAQQVISVAKSLWPRI